MPEVPGRRACRQHVTGGGQDAGDQGHGGARADADHRAEQGDEQQVPHASPGRHEHDQETDAPGEGKAAEGQQCRRAAGRAEPRREQPDLQAIEDPRSERPGQCDGNGAGGERLLERRAPGQPEQPPEPVIEHLRVQADQQERSGQEGPQVGRRSRHEGQRDQGGEQPAEQGKEHGEHRGAARVMPGHAVGVAQLHLRQHRPHRAGEVLAQLADEHDPGPDPDRQRRPERGEQHPPHLHRREHGQQHADHGGGYRQHPDAGQRGPHFRPLAGHPVAAEGDRGRGEAPADRPAGENPPDRGPPGTSPALRHVVTTGPLACDGGRAIREHGAIRHNDSLTLGFRHSGVPDYRQDREH